MKFAWLPTRVWRAHAEPESAPALAKAWRNGWWPDGWVWLGWVRRANNLFGDTYFVRLDPND